MTTHALTAAALLVLGATVALADPPAPTRTPLRQVVDLAVGESADVTLADGAKATIKLVAVEADTDGLRGAVREARARVEVNGQAATLTSANYRLPVAVGGVRIDCPITRAYYANTNQDRWGLAKDARLRLWPAGGPLLAEGTFVYPARQRWFASDTQMANEPVFVDAGETAQPKVYYHSGLDIGGAEAMVDVYAATAGLVVSAGKDALPGYEKTPVGVRYDVVYVLDDRGWYYRYSHLKAIDPDIRPGRRVRMGDDLGVLGKEGASGGWSHLHFEIVARQPSGQWGTEEGYAYLWEAYLRQFAPAVVAVARPHILALVGRPVTLDGSRSWTAEGTPAFQWTFSDGATAAGPTAVRTYAAPGTYSEILKVTDPKGRAAWDFAVVQVFDPAARDRPPPAIHGAYSPTTGLKAGDPVTFKVRSFRTAEGQETWDFGDGSPAVQVHSDGNAVALAPDGYATTVHVFAKPGDYLVRVERDGQHGAKATAHLWVHVAPAGEPQGP